ncbi:hypothetical protein T492DRAFT_867109 [Pavlovales sp. CCMP2436]|nr:hypothetical protein T492DRAFT_867109 [Pavlovales sp. CCMP2436]
MCCRGMRGFGRKAAGAASEDDLFESVLSSDDEEPQSSISNTEPGQSSAACLDDMFSLFDARVPARALVYTPPSKTRSVAAARAPAAQCADGSPSASMKLFEAIAGLSRPADRNPAAMRNPAVMRGADAKGRKPKGGRKPSIQPAAAPSDWPSLREQIESLIDKQGADVDFAAHACEPLLYHALILLDSELALDISRLLIDRGAAVDARATDGR